MAGIQITDQYDALLTTTLRNYRKKLIDNIFNGMPFLKWLRSKNRVRKVDGGAHIIEHLLYGKNTTFAAYSGYSQLDTTPQEGLTVAQYNWKEYGGTISISRREERQNSGPHKMIDLLDAKTKQAEQSIRDKVTEHLFADITSEPALNITGIFLIASSSPSTTTVGSVSGATYTWWRNYQADVGAYNSNLEDKMRTAYNTTSTGGADFIDGIVCSQTAFEYYESLGVGAKRFNDERKELDLGFEVLKYKGADMFWDAGLASGVPETGETMLFLNSDALKLVVDKESDLITTDFVTPENQSARTAKVLWMLNLTTNNRRKLGLLHGIDAT